MSNNNNNNSNDITNKRKRSNEYEISVEDEGCYSIDIIDSNNTFKYGPLLKMLIPLRIFNGNNDFKLFQKYNGKNIQELDDFDLDEIDEIDELVKLIKKYSEDYCIINIRKELKTRRIYKRKEGRQFVFNINIPKYIHSQVRIDDIIIIYC
jgi:hypothetical protein